MTDVKFHISHLNHGLPLTSLQVPQPSMLHIVVEGGLTPKHPTPLPGLDDWSSFMISTIGSCLLRSQSTWNYLGSEHSLQSAMDLGSRNQLGQSELVAGLESFNQLKKYGRITRSRIRYTIWACKSGNQFKQFELFGGPKICMQAEENPS